jgi:hypothetical protein
MDLDALDSETGGPMRVRHGKHIVTLAPATEMSWRVVMTVAVDPYQFGQRVWPITHRLTFRSLKRVQAAWRKHNGLPGPDQCSRLAYMVDRYFKGIEYDLRNHLHLSLGEIWRARRWRELLVYIDTLPTNSHMHRLLTSDEEYMERILTSKDAQRDDERSGRPSMADWSLTNSLLAQLIDAVRQNTQITMAAAGSKQSLNLQPAPRPWTAADKVNHRIEQRKHEEMVSMLIPGR